MIKKKGKDDKRYEERSIERRIDGKGKQKR